MFIETTIKRTIVGSHTVLDLALVVTVCIFLGGGVLSVVQSSVACVLVSSSVVRCSQNVPTMS